MFLFTIVLIIAVFSFHLLLSILNYRHRTQPIPDNVADVYDPKAYQKWLAYTMEVFKLSMITRVISVTVLLAFLLFGIFPKLADVAATITTHTVLQVLIFLALYAGIDYLLGIGFKLYRTFSIEARYGFNKSTVKTFVLDQVKGLLLAVILGGGLLYALLSLYLWLGYRSLLYGWLLLVGVMTITNLLYQKVFIRIFNKLTPLEEGEVYDKAQALAKETGYELKGISVMDASRRSSRLNAFFTGFGRFKHVVLFDTLLEKCTPDEVVSVLAHEIGHAKHKDVLRSYVISVGLTGFYLALLLYFLSSSTLSAAFGFDQVHLGFGLILFAILMEPVGLVLNLPLNALSRRAEFRADAFAAEHTEPAHMVSALKVLARENFANLTPHPFVVRMMFSHPPVSERIDALIE